MNIDKGYINLQIFDRLIYLPSYGTTCTFYKFTNEHLEHFKNNKFDNKYYSNAIDKVGGYNENLDIKNIVDKKDVFVHDIYYEKDDELNLTVIICTIHNDIPYYCIVRNSDYLTNRFKIDMKYRRLKNLKALGI